MSSFHGGCEAWRHPMIIYGIKKVWFVGGMTSSLGTAQKHSITHSLKAQEGTKQ